jgi:hypothetical protein
MSNQRGWQIAFIVVGVSATIAYVVGKETDATARAQIACAENGGTWGRPAWNAPAGCLGARGKATNP